MFVKQLLTVAVLVMLATSCKSRVAADQGETALRGVMTVYVGGHGLGSVQTLSGECVDLALPKNVLRRSGAWDGKAVVITGTMDSRPRSLNILWYDIRDRRIEGGGCSDDVLYVQTIKALR
ncbi:hypothetical protein SOM22_11645 [Stenotrophomonas rhizophila]|uniref:hypothetical protein n=1 Tax=Stenotrophomonas rhizophila TaxID=216778 RepID=UPI002A699125|nr:hypothetical protein [Stenotrophomonas rhizophila]MDY0955233.1 hypothetical protein [Stenotrophomonas rhizophila]